METSYVRIPSSAPYAWAIYFFLNQILYSLSQFITYFSRTSFSDNTTILIFTLLSLGLVAMAVGVGIVGIIQIVVNIVRLLRNRPAFNGGKVFINILLLVILTAVSYGATSMIPQAPPIR